MLRWKQKSLTWVFILAVPVVVIYSELHWLGFAQISYENSKNLLPIIYKFGFLLPLRDSSIKYGKIVNIWPSKLSDVCFLYKKSLKPKPGQKRRFVIFKCSRTLLISLHE